VRASSAERALQRKLVDLAESGSRLRNRGMYEPVGSSITTASSRPFVA